MGTRYGYQQWRETKNVGKKCRKRHIFKDIGSSLNLEKKEILTVNLLPFTKLHSQHYQMQLTYCMDVLDILDFIFFISLKGTEYKDVN